MNIINQYHYRKSKIILKAVIYLIFSIVIVLFVIMAIRRWDLSFMFHDWKGWLIMTVFSLVALGVFISCFEAFAKLGKARKGIPALIVAEDRFLVFNKQGRETTIKFNDCESVKIKTEQYGREYYKRKLRLVIKYRNDIRSNEITRVDIDLSELDQSQYQIEKAVMAAYNNSRLA